MRKVQRSRSALVMASQWCFIGMAMCIPAEKVTLEGWAWVTRRTAEASSKELCGFWRTAYRSRTWRLEAGTVWLSQKMETFMAGASTSTISWVRTMGTERTLTSQSR